MRFACVPFNRRQTRQSSDYSDGNARLSRYAARRLVPCVQLTRGFDALQRRVCRVERAVKEAFDIFHESLLVSLLDIRRKMFNF